MLFSHRLAGIRKFMPFPRVFNNYVHQTAKHFILGCINVVSNYFKHIFFTFKGDSRTAVSNDRCSRLQPSTFSWYCGASYLSPSWRLLIRFKSDEFGGYKLVGWHNAPPPTRPLRLKAEFCTQCPHVPHVWV